ncbi:hypothetical protein [Streptomyces cylindrosporus]|uniref:Uncharacterized protein n=1 Tax=Streptomyces cylindrosporus TaxID=2927583 RepID=A0ABS9YIB3_9ACTN|nr:hypothetical protein [Streptomyces cylindrosporus]MCI3276982.1 hypothetical protein [Streptomyces cylindrosporus]
MPTSTARSTQFLLERFSPKQILSINAANRRINLWEGAVSSGKKPYLNRSWNVRVEQVSRLGDLPVVRA